MLLKIHDEDLNVADNAIIALPPKCPATKTFKEVVETAIDHPIDGLPLHKYDLANKQICIMVDDWGRPTPAGEFLPSVLNRLNEAGAQDKDITIVTASGMHNPMEEVDLQRKVGQEAYRRVRCISHDGGNIDMLEFVGITDLGTPIWVNNYVANADFKVALGRIHPHNCYGYEGGYKMIVPGVASFETILRDHSLNFSPLSNYGSNINNPSRIEADAVGKMVGIDFIVNFVMTLDSEPVTAFGGTPEEVYPAGVDYGQRNVWCGKTGKKADITIMSSSELGDLSLTNNPIYYLGLAAAITEDEGIIIAKMDYQPRERNIVDGITLGDLSFSELIRMHERRNWNFPRRQIQHNIKAIRGEFYYRRTFELRSQKLYIVSDTFPASILEKWHAQQFTTIQHAYDAAQQQVKCLNPTVVLLPKAQQTLPVVEYDYNA
jgi:nickel-dependent lactate racemase